MTRNLRQSNAMRTRIRRTPIVLLLLGLAALIAADRFIGLGLNGFDYAALILITLFALKGYLQGLVNTVFSLLGYVAGAIGAILLSPSLAAWALKHTGLGPGLSERLGKMLPMLSGIPATAPSTTSGLSSAAAWLAANPAAKQALAGQPLLRQAFQTANPFPAGGAAPATNLNDLLVYSLLRILAVFLLFLLFKLVLALIGHFITSLMNLSTVLGTANRTAGMAFGLLIGFIILYVLVGTVIPFLGSLHFLKIPAAFTDSKVLSWFNALVAIIGKSR